MSTWRISDRMSLRDHSKGQLLESIKAGRRNLKKKDRQLRDLADKVAMAEAKLWLTECTLGLYAQTIDALWDDLNIVERADFRQRYPDLVQVAIEATEVISHADD